METSVVLWATRSLLEINGHTRTIGPVSNLILQMIVMRASKVHDVADYACTSEHCVVTTLSRLRREGIPVQRHSGTYYLKAQLMIG